MKKSARNIPSNTAIQKLHIEISDILYIYDRGICSSTLSWIDNTNSADENNRTTDFFRAQYLLLVKQETLAENKLNTDFRPEPTVCGSFVMLLFENEPNL